MKSILDQQSRDDIQQRAQMTQYQLAALSIRLDKQTILSELASLEYINKLKVSKSYDCNQVVSLLINGWNTEFLLRANMEKST